LSTLLSQLLVAFTIEFDNEFEHRMPHWTTDGGRATGPKGSPWLVSQVLWVNVMQYLDDEGITVGELHARSKTRADSLAGLERWKYLVVRPATGAGDANGATRAARAAVEAHPERFLVRATSAGREARAVWGPLAADVEARWVQRFGRDAIDDLRRALQAVRAQFEIELPQYLPIVFPTQNGRAGKSLLSEPARRSVTTAPEDLSVLLAQVLLQFALDYEAEARVSLTIAANTLRVLDEAGVPVRDLPRLTGVSKEANSMALGFLARRECLVLEPDPSARRGKRVRLTPRGKQSQDRYHRLLAVTEEHWKGRFGAEAIAHLRQSLHQVVGDQIPGPTSVLFEGLTTYADGWRASKKPVETLPHYPMVLHRGGYPDGS
jgi:DNA-binding MarR family transcriptional regulator